MSPHVKTIVVVVGLCIIAGAAARSTWAAPIIIELSAGGEAAVGIGFDGATLATLEGGNLDTAGEQDTAAQFMDFLDWVPEISTPTASFTLDGLIASGQANVFMGSAVVQNFTGGSFWLYAPDNSLLLSGALSTSVLAASINVPEGGLFTSSFSLVTGGELAPYIIPDSLVLQMHFSSINGNDGLSVTPPPGDSPPTVYQATLESFTATAIVEVLAQQIPEPASGTLIAIGGALAAVAVRRRHRRAR